MTGSKENLDTRLGEQAKRNRDKLPLQFMFQLTGSNESMEKFDNPEPRNPGGFKRKDEK